MPRTYKKKTNRGSWTDGQMQLAINCVHEGKSFCHASQQFGVPRTTLCRKYFEYYKERDDHNDQISEQDQVVVYKKTPPGFRRVFTDDQEKALYNYIIQMETNLMGLTSSEVRRLAFSLAEKLVIPHNFNRETGADSSLPLANQSCTSILFDGAISSIRVGLARVDWFSNFKLRHSLTLRKSEATSRARAFGFNKQSVQQFFILFKHIKETGNIDDEDIWNVDESPVTVNPKQAPLVVAQKGRRQVGGMTSMERGKLVTAELCMSAGGRYMPPMLVFPLKNAKKEYLEGHPEGSWAEWNASGWIDAPSFFGWFKEFVKFSGASKDKKVMLILDGHASHVKNLEVIDYANEHGVFILCLPPHCTHKLQPLDVGFMKPLSHMYTQVVCAEQRRTRRANQMKDIFQMFGKAWKNVTTNGDIAKNAFRRTGMVPFNDSIFDDSQFADLEAASSESSPNSSMNVSAETSICTQPIHQIQNPEAPATSQDPSAVSEPRDEVLKNIFMQLKSAVDQLGKVISNDEPTISGSLGQTNVTLQATNAPQRPIGLVENLAFLLASNSTRSGTCTSADVINEIAESTPSASTSHEPAPSADTSSSTTHENIDLNQSTANENSNNRPKNRAFLVNDENYRPSLIAAKSKTTGRKRKTDQPFADQTNKRGRPRKKKISALESNSVQPSVMQNSQVPPVINLDSQVVHVPPAFLQIPGCSNDRGISALTQYSQALAGNSIAPAEIEFVDQFEPSNQTAHDLYPLVGPFA